MAHFAKINAEKLVIQVIVISDDACPDPAPNNEAQGQAFIADVLGLDGEWKQTSYNGKFRGNYADIGYYYDETLDAFISPQPYFSWTLNEVTLLWDPPVPYPNDGESYVWDENAFNWIPVIFGE